MFAKARCLSVACAVALAASVCAWAETFYVATSGNDAAAGAESAPLLTVQAALQKAHAGDTVFVKAGVYRGRLTFPRDGAAGKPIVLTGEAGAIIDGGTILTGWQRAPEAGGNIYRAAYTGPQPYNLTWNNKYILVIRDEFMAKDGMTILKDGPSGWDTYGGKPYRGWDGVEAMWGVMDGSVYLGFGDASVAPSKEEITIAPGGKDGGAAITIDARKFITVRGLTVRNGYHAILVHNSTDCLIENNTLLGGWHTVEIENVSSRVVVRKNEVTLGYVHTLKPDDPRHWFIWAAFKQTSLWDRICVDLRDVGSDNEVCENHLFENFDGVQNQRAGRRLNVHHNLIEDLADDGLEPDGEETECQWHDNVVRNCNIAYRHKGITGPGPMYTYRNLFIARPAPGRSECSGVYFFGGSATEAYIYQNTFATPRGGSFGSTLVEIGLPNTCVVNNIFSCNSVMRESRSWKILPHFDYNYCGGEEVTALSFWGPDNKIVKGGELWDLATEKDYRLAADSPARAMGIDLSKPWTLDGKTHPALPGMTPGYFEGAKPDAGAFQYHK